MSATRCLWAVSLAAILLAGGCALRHARFASGGDAEPPELGQWSDNPWATGQPAPGLVPRLHQSRASDSPVRHAVADVSATESGNVRLASGTILTAPLKALSSGIAAGAEKVSEAFAPSIQEPSDPTSLAVKSAPTPQLFLAMARLAEQSGHMDEAEQRYRQAMQIDPRNLDAVVGYARMKDRQGRLDDAIELYQQAAKAHPENAMVFNDLGLCLARRNQTDKAMAALERSIQLDAKDPLYRNNIATVLVEQGNIDAAYTHLAAVHPQAVAYYNVGYLLYKKGQPQAAAALFSQALKVDPSLEQARAWLDKLNGSPSAAVPAARRRAAAPDPIEDPAVEAPDLRAMRRQAVIPGRRTPTIYPPPREKPHPIPAINEGPMPVVTAPETTHEPLLPRVRQLPSVFESDRRRKVVPQSYENAPLPPEKSTEEEPEADKVEPPPAELPPQQEDALPAPLPDDTEDEAVPLAEGAAS